MAKKSVIARQKKREVLIAKYADIRAKLKAAGYLYAEGIRNAYDMAFDGAGNLFGV